MAKKPTMKQVKNAIDNLITEVIQLKSSVVHIDGLLGGYIRFKKDKDKFAKWVDEKVKEYNEQSKTNSDRDSSKGVKEIARKERQSPERVPSNENVR